MRRQVPACLQFTFDECLVNDYLNPVMSVSSLLCRVSTCLRMGSKLRCIRSTLTEMQSMRENDFECFASTGVTLQEQCFQFGDLA